MRTMACASLLLLMTSGVVWAEEERQGTPEEEDVRPAERRPIRVLQHPYDLASYYRSRPGAQGFFDGASERYPIASFYRSGQGGAYGDFWAYGSAGRRRGSQPMRARRGNGEFTDLYLFAPTILAPVGPLSEVFLGER